MESNQFTRKLVRWAFIQQEYDFDIIHRLGRVNRDADGLNQNPSSNEDDTIETHWHGDVDLEVVPRWHASTYLCTLLGCFGDVPHTSVDDGDPHDVDMESKGNGALDIYDDAPVIAYLQEGEVPIGLTPKERDRVVHRAKWFKWEGNSFLRMWVDRQVKVLPCPEQRENVVRHCRNPSLGLATKARACKGEGQKGSLGVTSHVPGSVGPTLGIGVLMDFRIFRDTIRNFGFCN
jgi:hypothetical protein